MTLPPIVPNLVRLARSAARADAAGLWLLDASGQHLENVNYDGLPIENIECVRHLPVGVMTCGKVVVTRKPSIARDLRNDPEYAAAHHTPIRACFSVPIVGRSGTVHGSLACHFKKVHAPSTYDIERNELFAQLIAFALEEAEISTAA